MRNRQFTTLASGLVLLLAGMVPVMAQGGRVPGAIFTTLGDGTRVNANLFASKCSVYLDGGPGPNAPAGAAGLPDGDYYFQVTGPSGAELLSTDPVNNRSFRVSGGVIVQRYGTHPIGVDMDQSQLGAITIRLAGMNCPADFLDSTNAGSVYKVWVTPTSDFVGDPTQVDNPCGKGCFHGFVAAASKTDNFKTRLGTPTFCLNVQKQLLNADLVTYSPAPNWPITVTDPLLVQNTYNTDLSGQVKICGLTDGSYMVEEQLNDVPACPYGANTDGLLVNDMAIIPPSGTYSFTWSSKNGPSSMVILFKNSCNPGVG